MFGVDSGIARSGSPGSYSYSVIGNGADEPVSYVSFFDALRFANWMNNGQGNGDTETGGYTLKGGFPEPSNGSIVQRNAGASIVLTSEDEWYRGRLLQRAGYRDYATGNFPPTCSAPTANANSANCQGAGGGSRAWAATRARPARTARSTRAAT